MNQAELSHVFGGFCQIIEVVVIVGISNPDPEVLHNCLQFGEALTGRFPSIDFLILQKPMAWSQFAGTVVFGTRLQVVRKNCRLMEGAAHGLDDGRNSRGPGVVMVFGKHSAAVADRAAVDCQPIAVSLPIVDNHGGRLIS